MYLLHILILIAIYSILALSLDLVAGHSGLLSVAHAGFFGLGAYASSLITLDLGLPFVWSVAGAMSFSAAVSLLVSLPALRLHDTFFVICTFGLQIIVTGLMNNLTDITRGPSGIYGIPRPELFGWPVRSDFLLLVISCGFLVVTYLTIKRLIRGAFGRILHAIREDEVWAQVLGKNTNRFKLSSFAVSACFAGAAGSLYAHYIGYVNPANFDVSESILILSMVIVGGAASPHGSVLGAALLVIFPEILRYVGFSGGEAANLRQIIYGAVLVLLMLVRPRGILGKYDFGE